MAPKIGFFITGNEMAKFNGKSMCVCACLCNERPTLCGTFWSRSHISFDDMHNCESAVWLHAYCNTTEEPKRMNEWKVSNSSARDAKKKSREEMNGRVPHTKGIRAIRFKLKILNAIFATLIRSFSSVSFAWKDSAFFSPLFHNLFTEKHARISLLNFHSWTHPACFDHHRHTHAHSHMRHNGRLPPIEFDGRASNNVYQWPDISVHDLWIKRFSPLIIIGSLRFRLFSCVAHGRCHNGQLTWSISLRLIEWSYIKLRRTTTMKVRTHQFHDANNLNRQQ